MVSATKGRSLILSPPPSTYSSNHPWRQTVSLFLSRVPMPPPAAHTERQRETSNTEQRSGLSVWTSSVFTLWFVFLFGEGCSPAAPALRWLLFSAPAVLSTSNGMAYSIRYAPSWQPDRGCISLSLSFSFLTLRLESSSPESKHNTSCHLTFQCSMPPLPATFSSSCGATLPPQVCLGFAASFFTGWRRADSDLLTAPFGSWEYNVRCYIPSVEEGVFIHSVEN